MMAAVIGSLGWVGGWRGHDERGIGSAGKFSSERAGAMFAFVGVARCRFVVALLDCRLRSSM